LYILDIVVILVVVDRGGVVCVSMFDVVVVLVVVVSCSMRLMFETNARGRKPTREASSSEAKELERTAMVSAFISLLVYVY
jgi:hypothetical protein